MMSQPLFWNTFILRRPRLASIATMFIKSTLKGSRKVKIINNCVLKMQFISVFFDITKVANFQWINADVSRTQGVCHVIYMIFGCSLRKV